MTFITQADETRRQAREGKEKGVPSGRVPLPSIDGDTGYLGSLYGDIASGDGNGGDGSETTETQESTPNETDDGSTAAGGSASYDSSDASTFASDAEADYTSGEDLENATSAPNDGACIGCAVEKMDGITAFDGDCSDGGGDCVKLHLDGEFPPVDGWDDPSSPPPDETWVQGLRFMYNSEYYHSTLQAAIDNIVAVRSAAYASSYAVYASTVPAFRKGDVINYTINIIIHYDSNDVAWTSESLTVFTQTCTPTEGNSSCPIDSPLATQWTDDGCYDLAFDGVKFSGSEYDPNLPADMLEGTSSVDYCTGGNTKGTAKTAVNGGYMLLTTGLVRVYDSNNQLVAAGDRTQALIDQYTP